MTLMDEDWSKRKAEKSHKKPNASGWNNAAKSFQLGGTSPQLHPWTEDTKESILR
jgi:hypothetical protein